MICISMRDILSAPGDETVGCYRAIASPAWPLHAAEHCIYSSPHVQWGGKH